MAEYLKAECPQCGQPIEYPAEGTGQTVPCPTCQQPFILTPSKPPEPAILAPPIPPSAPPLPPPPAPLPVPVPAPPTPAPTPTPPPVPVPKLNPPPPAISPFEQACLEFERDRAFEKHPPTREQVARAWALASFRESDTAESPTHQELVAALKKLFPEFRTSRPALSRSRSE